MTSNFRDNLFSCNSKNSSTYKWTWQTNNTNNNPWSISCSPNTFNTSNTNLFRMKIEFIASNANMHARNAEWKLNNDRTKIIITHWLMAAASGRYAAATRAIFSKEEYWWHRCCYRGCWLVNRHCCYRSYPRYFWLEE